MFALLSKVRDDICTEFQGKAECQDAQGSVRHMRATPEPALQHITPLTSPPEAPADGGSIVRWPVFEGKCVACDSRIDLRADDPFAWPHKMRAVPNSSWPIRPSNTAPVSLPNLKAKRRGLPSTWLATEK